MYGIYWHQGLFLQPQHFQLLERNLEKGRRPLFESCTPHLWGVGELTLSEDALAARTLEVRSAKLLFRGDSYAEYPGNCIISPRSFDTVWTDTERPLDVYLGLRSLSNAGANVTLVPSFHDALKVSTRFVSLEDPDEVADLYSDGPKSRIPTVYQSIPIIFGPELDLYENCELIKIARLIRDGDRVLLASDFTPPCYMLGSSKLLSELVQDVRDDMAGRLSQLAAYKLPQDQLKRELTADSMILMQAIQILSRNVPLLSHLLHTPTVHPWSVFAVLVSIIGELSIFSSRIDFMGRRDGGSETMPQYNHEDPHPGFRQARLLINALLNEISIGPEAMIPLVSVGDYYAAQIPSEYLEGRKRFYLVINSQSLTEQMAVDFLRTARLCNPFVLASKIDHALPGVELIEVGSPPQGIPRQPGSRYYRIEQMSEEWDSVQREGRIGLFWKDSPQDFKAEIAVIRS